MISVGKSPAAAAAQFLTPVRQGMLQRKCACGGTPGPSGECEECRNKRLQRKAAAPRTADQASPVAPPIVHEVLRSPGQPLDATTRAFMEPRFGHDFSKVRVHSDARAAESARAVSAQAYTVGRDVVFGAGKLEPATRGGRMLIAHELAHVIQQNGAQVHLQKLSFSTGDAGGSEREANSAAQAVVAGHNVRVMGFVNSVRLQRAGDDDLPGGINLGGAAGGCGICYGGDIKQIGLDAHTQIKQDFQIKYPLLLPDLPIKLDIPTRIISEGVPDLIVATPSGLKIGEIKPANPEGYIEGEAKLQIYTQLIRELYPKSSVARMDEAPPEPIPFIEPAAAGCATQMMIVNRSVQGVYGYLCDPPFSFALRSQCKCNGEVDDPVPVPIWDIIMVLALAAAAVKFREQLKKLIPGLAPATAAAALIALLQGKKLAFAAGEDPLEAVFDASAKGGSPMPDDIKDAIRKDPGLRKLVENVASGKMEATDAQRELSEQAMRAIIENRNKLTDADLEELAKMANESKATKKTVTAEDLRREIDAARAGGAKNPGGKGTAPPAPEMKQPPAPDTAPSPKLSNDVLKRLRGDEAANEIVNELTVGGESGTKVDDAFVEALLKLTQDAKPPLTKAEAAELAAAVRANKEMRPEEVLDSVRKAIARRPATTGSGGPLSPEEQPPGLSPGNATIPFPDPNLMTDAIDAAEKAKTEKQNGVQARKIIADKNNSAGLADGGLRPLRRDDIPADLSIRQGTALPTIWVIVKKGGQLFAAIVTPVASTQVAEGAAERWSVNTAPAQMYDAAGNSAGELPPQSFELNVNRGKAKGRR